MNHSVSVILPTFRENENLKLLLPELISMFEKQNYIYEIIIVDDDSNDGSKKTISEFNNNNIIFIERKNVRGLASALLEGTDLASNEIIVHMDSDLAHRVEDLEHILTIYNKINSETLLIIGSRYHTNSLYDGKPILNRITSFLGRTIVKYYLNLNIEDSSNNFRVFNKNGWIKIRKGLLNNGNIVIIQIAYLLQCVGFNIKEVNIVYKERILGYTKHNILKETVIFFSQLLKVKNSIKKIK